MNGTCRNFAFRALVWLLFVPAPALAATSVHDAITTQCLREEVELSGLEVSPDGARLVVTATRSDFEANRHLSELLLIDTSTGAARTLSTRQDIFDVSWS